MQECRCRGTNEKCMFCSGKGYLTEADLAELQPRRRDAAMTASRKKRRPSRPIAPLPGAASDASGVSPRQVVTQPGPGAPQPGRTAFETHSRCPGRVPSAARLDLPVARTKAEFAQEFEFTQEGALLGGLPQLPRASTRGPSCEAPGPGTRSGQPGRAAEAFQSEARDPILPFPARATTPITLTLQVRPPLPRPGWQGGRRSNGKPVRESLVPVRAGKQGRGSGGRKKRAGPPRGAAPAGPLLTCADCGAAVAANAPHAKRCPRSALGLPGHPLGAGAIHAGRAPEARELMPQEEVEARLDRTFALGSLARDQGRFGSPVIHDGYDDESEA